MKYKIEEVEYKSGKVRYIVYVLEFLFFWNPLCSRESFYLRPKLYKTRQKAENAALKIIGESENKRRISKSWKA